MNWPPLALQLRTWARPVLHALEMMPQCEQTVSFGQRSVGVAGAIVTAEGHAEGYL